MAQITPKVLSKDVRLNTSTEQRCFQGDWWSKGDSFAMNLGEKWRGKGEKVEKRGNTGKIDHYFPNSPDSSRHLCSSRAEREDVCGRLITSGFQGFRQFFKMTVFD